MDLLSPFVSYGLSKAVTVIDVFVLLTVEGANSESDLVHV